MLRGFFKSLLYVISTIFGICAPLLFRFFLEDKGTYEPVCSTLKQVALLVTKSHFDVNRHALKGLGKQNNTQIWGNSRKGLEAKLLQSKELSSQET